MRKGEIQNWYAPSEDPELDELLDTCDTLWRAFFFRELLDDLKDLEGATEERQQRMVAGMTSLLSAIQGELTYAEQPSMPTCVRQL